LTIEISTLSNGLRVVTQDMPHVETVALGMWVASGARHETEVQNGISHLLEHMAFKGTSRRSARDIAEEIEQVGGELNAATSLESTAYYARILKADTPLALELLADILQGSVFAADELGREREVILQEIASTRDSPEEIGFDLVQEAAYPAQPLGRSILGTPESVVGITPGDLRNFLGERYRAPGMVLSAAGNVSHDLVVRHAERLFSGLDAHPASGMAEARYVGGWRATEKPFEQCHLMMTFESPSYRDGSFYTAQVLSGLLGGGMSSRLFQEVRERRGLCYSIYSSCYGLGDTGLFSVHAATGTDMMNELTSVVCGELRLVAEKAPQAAELQRAKAQLKAGLLMSLESPTSRSEQLARQLILFGRVVDVRELVEKVDAVTGEAVREAAGRIVTAKPATVVVVGAGRRSAGFAQTAAKAIAA